MKIVFFTIFARSDLICRLTEDHGSRYDLRLPMVRSISVNVLVTTPLGFNPPGPA